MAGLNNARQLADANPPSKAERAQAIADFPNMPLPVGQDATFVVSKDGAHGVVMAEMPLQGGGKAEAVLKLEGKWNHGGAAYVGSLLDHVQSNAASPLPFGMARHQLVRLSDLSEVERTALTAVARADRAERPGPGAARAGADLSRLHHAGASQLQRGVLSKYEKLDGQQLNKMSAGEKLAMIKARQLGQDLGAAMVLTHLFGLKDHGTPGALGGYSNLANYIMTSEGRPSVIDYDPNIGESTTALATPRRTSARR